MYTEKEIIASIEKLKYHVKILGEAINYLEHPLESLIISMDWDEETLNKVHDTFEKYDELLQNNSEVSWSTFKNEIESKFGISYQSLKSVISAFYRNGMWTQVCVQYSKNQPSAELDFIIRENKNN